MMARVKDKMRFLKGHSFLKNVLEVVWLIYYMVVEIGMMQNIINEANLKQNKFLSKSNNNHWHLKIILLRILFII